MAATISSGTLAVVVTFDRVLRTSVLGTLPWLAIANIGAGIRRFKPLAGPVATGLTVTFTARDIGGGAGANIISYGGALADLFGKHGSKVADFNNFPISVLP